ncbi:MAG: transcription termination factor NusA [Elusimicrobia bacterium]|nr:transcription termination factor NusA [Elusimicrobiota bacterium]
MAKSELMTALEQIAREKNIPVEEILTMIEGAVVSSLRKHVGKDADIRATIDRDSGQFSAVVVKKVVEAVTTPDLEMTVDEARRHKKSAKVGDEVVYEAPAADFARIAAQTAKQVLTQRVREVERDKLYEEYKPKEGEIINGSVHRFLDRNIIVDLGKTEAILPLREQIRRERYGIGGNVRAVILRVDKAQRGPAVVLSRAAELFLQRLMEQEIPEIADKTVEVVHIVRDPGFRAKVIVKSNDPKVDAIGACVGLRGSRIRSIMNEVAGERIDLIPHAERAEQALANALAPAKVASVRIVDAENRVAEILVAEEQLALAIGKDGQNVRLAQKLTGWTLEVKSEGQKRAETSSARSAAAEGLATLEGVGPKTVEALVKAGVTDVAQLAALAPEDLKERAGIGEKTAAKIVAAAKAAVAAAPTPEASPEEAAGPAEPGAASQA